MEQHRFQHRDSCDHSITSSQRGKFTEKREPVGEQFVCCPGLLTFAGLEASPDHRERLRVYEYGERGPIDTDQWRKDYWYKTLRALSIRERKFYATRHTYISAGLSNRINIKWLAEYCGTSVAMIEKHFGKYFRGDVDEQFSRLLGTKTETFPETFQRSDLTLRIMWRPRRDLNPCCHLPVSFKNF